MTLKDFMDRYGPTLAVVTMLAVLAVLLPGNAGGGDDTGLNVGTNRAGAGGDGVFSDAETSLAADGGAVGGDVVGGGRAAAGSAGRAATGGSGGGTKLSGTSTESVAPPGGVKFGSGPNCREDGRQKSFWYGAPPCVDWTPGTPNGGVTDKGVTADKILVIRYRAPENAATSAALTGAGATDSREDSEKQHQGLVKYFNQHYETYGREVVLKIYDAPANSGNEESSRADAIKIADMGAFAVINANSVVAAELARRGVPCMCTTSMSRTFYGALPPYIFSSLPTGEEYGIHRAEYVGKRLAGRPAKWAGDPAFQVQERTFGLIWYEGSNGRADPGYRASRDAFVAELAKYGVRLTAEFSFLYDINKAPDQATAMIQKMKSEGVNHVMLAMDPLYPIFITNEATRQNYFPEWGISGTALTDTTFFGRTYNKTQMESAFGISPLYVSWANFESSPGYREYKHGDPSSPSGSQGQVAINVNRSDVAILFTGIHMAGPNLNENTFSQGLLAFPAIGGSPARPLLKYSRQDPTWYKDFNEIFWDNTWQGKDEVNKDGVGAYLHVDGGKRYLAGQWPTTEPKVFTRDRAVFTSDNPPGGPQATNHNADGHTHEPSQRCLSCPG